MTEEELSSDLKDTDKVQQLNIENILNKQTGEVYEIRTGTRGSVDVPENTSITSTEKKALDAERDMDRLEGAAAARDEVTIQPLRDRPIGVTKISKAKEKLEGGSYQIIEQDTPKTSQDLIGISQTSRSESQEANMCTRFTDNMTYIQKESNGDTYFVPVKSQQDIQNPVAVTKKINEPEDDIKVNRFRVPIR